MDQGGGRGGETGGCSRGRWGEGGTLSTGGGEGMLQIMVGGGGKGKGKKNMSWSWGGGRSLVSLQKKEQARFCGGLVKGEGGGGGNR